MFPDCQIRQIYVYFLPHMIVNCAFYIFTIFWHYKDKTMNLNENKCKYTALTMTVMILINVVIKPNSAHKTAHKKIPNKARFGGVDQCILKDSAGNIHKFYDGE